MAEDYQEGQEKAPNDMSTYRQEALDKLASIKVAIGSMGQTRDPAARQTVEELLENFRRMIEEWGKMAGMEGQPPVDGAPSNEMDLQNKIKDVMSNL